jgi:16S rRNA G966 N2-methylase RsmD
MLELKSTARSLLASGGVRLALARAWAYVVTLLRDSPAFEPVIATPFQSFQAKTRSTRYGLNRKRSTAARSSPRLQLVFGDPPWHGKRRAHRV